MAPRARELGIPFSGVPGPENAITDVPGVLVGQTTLIEGASGPHQVRTGVTAILPRGFDRPLRPVWSGTFSLNGNGEMTGTHWIRDGGYFCGPIVLTNTHAVGVAHHATVRWMIDYYPDEFHNHHLWALPVVAETYDGVLNDINAQPIQPSHIIEAINGAKAGPVREGNSGGGTGMIAYGFKGGTGTASRQVDVKGSPYHLGVLVQANHGAREWFQVKGLPYGVEGDGQNAGDLGSIIVIVATDLPMLPHQLTRVARRAALGIGRQGTAGGNSSGDIFLAFTTANPPPLPTDLDPWITLSALADPYFDGVYQAVVESIEEAVLNAMVAAEPMSYAKPPGRMIERVDLRRLVNLATRSGTGNEQGP